MQANTNIYLVGLMGAGKTTIGRQLARRMGRQFLDSDHEIEARTGVSIPTIFEIEGEAGFRAREAQTIRELSQQDNLILATGGGAVINAGTRQHLHESGWVIYLDVPPEQLFERTKHDRNRPLLQVENPLQKLIDLHTARDPLYRETAHFTVDGARLQAGAMVNLLLREFNQRCAP